MFYFCILFSKEKGKSKEKQQKIKHSSVEQKLFRSAKEYRFPVDMKKSSFQSSSYIDVCVCARSAQNHQCIELKKNYGEKEKQKP